METSVRRITPKSLILGSLLGDGGLWQGKSLRFYESHGPDQKDYLSFKANILSVKYVKPYISGYGSHGFKLTYSNAPLLHSLVKLCYNGRKKKISTAWLEELDEFALAIWYQDDGSLGRAGMKYGDGRRSEIVVRLHTNGFPKADVDQLCQYLQERWSIRGSVRDYKGPVIILYHTQAIAFQRLIAPFTMLNYKLAAELRPSITQCKCGVLIDKRWRFCIDCINRDKSLVHQSTLYSLKNRKPIDPYLVNPVDVGSALDQKLFTPVPVRVQ